MIQFPKSLGLLLCDQVIIEKETNKPTLVGLVSGISFDSFPSPPRQIDAFTSLTDGQGKGLFKLSVTHLNKDQQIAEKTATLDFPDPLVVTNVRFRFRRLIFPEAGAYLFELNCNEEPICHRRVKVYLKEKT